MNKMVCETCVHFNVCQYKETFAAVLKDISEIDFIDFLEAKLKCKHYRVDTLAGAKGGLER